MRNLALQSLRERHHLAEPAGTTGRSHASKRSDLRSRTIATNCCINWTAVVSSGSRAQLLHQVLLLLRARGRIFEQQPG